MRLINAGTDSIDRATQDLYEVLNFLRKVAAPGHAVTHAELKQAIERQTCAMGLLSAAGIPMPILPSAQVKAHSRDRGSTEVPQ